MEDDQRKEPAGWERPSGPGSRWFQPAVNDRSRGIGDLSMGGMNIHAPAHLQRGRRMLQPAGASTPLGGSSGELPRTYSGSSARVDYRRRLELNTQDSDEDVLFRQEMRYPERGAGGFSNLRQAGAGESRASPPVQQLEESEYLTASESTSERGRSRHRGHPEDTPSASREETGEDAHQEDRGPPASASHHFGSSRPWAGMAADRPPMPLRHSASAPLPPREPPGMPSPRRGESIQQPRWDQYDSPPRGYGGAVPRQPQPQAGN